MRKRQPAVSHSSSSLNGMFKEVYEKKICDLIPNGPTNVHFVDYGKIEKRKGYMEDTMVLNTCEGQVEASPMVAELNNLKYRVKDLRDGIARKQEQLRIELAKLAAVKKLAKGGK